MKTLWQEIKDLFCPKLPDGYTLQINQFGQYRLVKPDGIIIDDIFDSKIKAIWLAHALEKKNKTSIWKDL